MQKITPPLDIVIRNARLEDANDIARINLNCWKINYKGIIDQSFLNDLKLNKVLNSGMRTIQEDLDIHLVATYNNRVVGFCDAGEFYFRAYQKTSKTQKENRNEPGEIYSIYVDPEFQNKGIGSTLFQHAKKKLFEGELTPFIVWSFKDNQAACKFYEKQGGKQVDEMIVTRGGDNYAEIAYVFETRKE